MEENEKKGMKNVKKRGRKAKRRRKLLFLDELPSPFIWIDVIE